MYRIAPLQHLETNRAEHWNCSLLNLSSIEQDKVSQQTLGRLEDSLVCWKLTKQSFSENLTCCVFAFYLFHLFTSGGREGRAEKGKGEKGKE